MSVFIMSLAVLLLSIHRGGLCHSLVLL